MSLKQSTVTADIPYAIGEEIANSILHGIGALGAITGLILLNLGLKGGFGGQKGSSQDIIAVIIYAAAMVGMFLASTLYHAIQHQRVKKILRIIDHSMVFILIAGTYTPFCLITLKGGWGWSIFAVEWFLAAAGITFNVLGNKNFKKIEIPLYILMGWVIVAGFVPLIRSIPVISLVLLFAGGIAYTLGTIWYRKKNITGTHAVWHCFVLIGAVCHWFSVWFLR